MFDIGDKVRIKDNSRTYAHYRSWLNNHATMEERLKWRFGETPESKIKVTIIRKDVHSDFCNLMLYLVQTKDDKIYLMGEDGLIKRK